MWKPSFVLLVRHGASKVLSAVYRYGTPPSLSALKALLDEDERQQEWQKYMADVGYRMIRLWSKGTTIKPYGEIVQPQKKMTDSRSKKEIADDLIARRRRRRGEVKNSETV